MLASEESRSKDVISCCSSALQVVGLRISSSVIIGLNTYFVVQYANASFRDPDAPEGTGSERISFEIRLYKDAWPGWSGEFPMFF